MRLEFRICFVILGVTFNWSKASDRVKRVVAFNEGTVYFTRINYKIASVPWSTIFNQAAGFKVTWPISDMSSRPRRETENPYESIHVMYESFGLHGQSCLARNICEAMNYVKRKDGIMGKILKLLARTSNINWTNTEDLTFNCNLHMLACPMQLINVNSFFEP